MPRPEAKKRLRDYVPGGAGVELEGTRLDNNDDMLGEDVELLDFVILQSREYSGEFAVIQFVWNDTKYTTAIGAAAVVEALKQQPKQYLPVMIKIVRLKSKKSGRYYLNIE